MEKLPLIFAFLFFCIAILPGLNCKPVDVVVDFQFPLGVRYEEVHVEKNSHLVGWLTLTEFGYEELQLTLELRLPEGFELASSSLGYTKTGYTYSLKRTVKETIPLTWSFIVKTPDEIGVFPVNLTVTLEHQGEVVYSETFSRILFLGLKPKYSASISVKAPCNPDGSFDAKMCTGVFVVEEFSENPILYFLGLMRKYTSLIGFSRIDVDLGDNASLLPVTLEVTLSSVSGEPAEGITLVHPGFESEGAEAKSSLSIYVKADEKGRVSAVVPLIALKDLDELEGDYRLKIRVRRLGSSIELGEAEFPVKVVVIRRGDVGCLLVGAASAIALLAAIFLDAFKKLSTLEVAYAALSASLVFAIAVIPGTIIWPIAQALLGPFDWILTGVLYAFLMYAIYGAMVKTSPRPGVFTLAITTKWLLYLFVFGVRNPFMSLIWLATTAFIMEPLLYVFGGTRKGATLGIASAFALGRFVDAYVDMNLYMIFYRLFYAQWYINLYCLGASIYTFTGAVLGCKLAEKLRGVSHE